MKRTPAQRLFFTCKLCGEDYSASHNPKASMARHLRHQHADAFKDYPTVTTGYMTEVLLRGQVPKCSNPECDELVRVQGFEFVAQYCSPGCSAKHQHAMGGAFTNPAAVSARNKVTWSDPAYQKKMKAIHGTLENRARVSKQSKAYWGTKGVKESRSTSHKAWWASVRGDKDFMFRRREASSKNASRLLQEHPQFGHAKVRDCAYKGIHMRSSWEVKLARKLDDLGFKWQYEPTTFKIGEGLRYTPDFYLPEVQLYLEVKPRNFAQGLAKDKLHALQQITKKPARFIDLKGIEGLSFEKLFNFVPDSTIKLRNTAA
jgi:hypothetical protein